MPPIPPAQLIPGTRYVVISRLSSSNPRWSGPAMDGRVFVGMDPGGTGNPGFLLERNGGVIYELPIATRYYAIGDPDIPVPGAIPRDLWRSNAPRAANYPIPENVEERARIAARANSLRAEAAAAANAASNAIARAVKKARIMTSGSASTRGGRRTRVKSNNRKNRNNRSSKRK